MSDTLWTIVGFFFGIGLGKFVRFILLFLLALVFEPSAIVLAIIAGGVSLLLAIPLWKWSKAVTIGFILNQIVWIILFVFVGISNIPLFD